MTDIISVTRQTEGTPADRKGRQNEEIAEPAELDVVEATKERHVIGLERSASPGTQSATLIDRFRVANSCQAVDTEAYSRAVAQHFSTAEDAFEHYQRSGRGACPELFPFIDPDYYTKQLVQQVPDTVTLFDHYVTVGAKQDLTPIPLFDPKYVRLQAEQLPFEDIFDFLSNPNLAPLDPHPLFSKRYYNSINVDVANARADPFIHYIRYGWQERRCIHPFFRVEEYHRLGFPPDCNRTEFNRYLASALDSPELALMQPLFDVSHYLQSLNPIEDVTAPLQHYLRIGWRQNASAFPLFDQKFFIDQMPKSRNSVSPYAEYLSDLSHAYGPNELFDPPFYLQSGGVEPSFRGSLLEHFVRFGAAKGARPHRMVLTMNGCPSVHSGFDVIQSFKDISGRVFWLCSPSSNGVLLARLNEINEIEPLLSGEILNLCRLHPYNGPVDEQSRLLIAIARKIARCNCLVVSEAALDENVISGLFSPSAFLVSNARPWLTLLSSSNLTIAYWHALHGCKAVFETTMAHGLGSRAVFVAKALMASIPNKLVVRTDAFGVALLRACGSQILAVIPQVSLLVEPVDLLGREDQHWLSEYIAVNYSEFASLILRGDWPAGLVADSQSAMLPNMPRVVKL